MSSIGERGRRAVRSGLAVGGWVCACASWGMAQPSGDPVARDRAEDALPIGEPVAFTEEAIERGIEYVVAGNNAGAGCAAFADLNGDDLADVVAVGAESGIVGVYENVGDGRFEDRSPESGIPALAKPAGITAADYDADGDLDLFITNIQNHNTLLRNDGDFKFADVTEALGVGGFAVGPSGGSAWGDYDGDGWLDLYVSNRTEPSPPLLENRLYRNLQGAGFTDVAPQLGVEDSGAPTLTVAFLDYDRDGDADLHLGTDKGNQCVQEQDRTFENVGGAYIDVTKETNTQACTDTMGIAVGDFDGNLLPDMYTTNTPSGNALMMQERPGEFVYRQDEAGVGSFAIGWGCSFIDYDNDADQELYVCNVGADNRLYDPTDGWPSEDLAEQLGLDHPGPSYNISYADIDEDGDLDLLLQDIPGRVRLYINHEGQRRQWVRLRVRGEHPNLHAIGAVVRVRTGDRWQAREVLAGGNNYRSQSELTLTFGLGRAERIDEVIVDWPGGTSRSFTGLSARKVWTLMPPPLLGDGDGDGRIDRNEIVELLWAMGRDVEPGMEHMDFDGDGRIDADDWVAMLGRVTGASGTRRR